jgi:hypothetical protein
MIRALEPKATEIGLSNKNILWLLSSRSLETYCLADVCPDVAMQRRQVYPILKAEAAGLSWSTLPQLGFSRTHLNN